MFLAAILSMVFVSELPHMSFRIQHCAEFVTETNLGLTYHEATFSQLSDGTRLCKSPVLIKRGESGNVLGVGGVLVGRLVSVPVLGVLSVGDSYVMVIREVNELHSDGFESGDLSAWRVVQ